MRLGAGRFRRLLSILIALSALVSAGLALADEKRIHVIQWGDTLGDIALRYGISVTQLLAANKLGTNPQVYVGRRLTIPGRTARSARSLKKTRSSAFSASTYTVQWRDTLADIAASFGIPVEQLIAENELGMNPHVNIGQQLKISSRARARLPRPPKPAKVKTLTNTSRSSGVKWIDINISAQKLTAYEGETLVYQAEISTGREGFPTAEGKFRIYAKYSTARMQRYNYDIPNVPFVMYFYTSYALHGTFWHSKFGTPVSHGCVNLSVPDAKWIFDWAPIGTRVLAHD